ncbi:uncharacterized protein LOC119070540 [Bradysia coprophila]|uniref:uncharacterized protein LOC119070540 n=1 Tax=Bradysia coprophila TaxID=38358 RepID=UPI00187D7FC3|nr:uncharacterized protein LOC119070540 [Bradysia coprophila]
MNIARKISIFCVVFCVALSSADITPQSPSLRGCFIPLLKSMGKLSADFEPNLPSQNPFICHSITGMGTILVKSLYLGEIKAILPNEADCLTEKFDQHGAIFDIIKLRILDETDTLDETEKQRQLEEARTDLTNIFDKIVADCPTDRQKFNNIFHIPLAIKNETLEAHQAKYCLAKYTIDNKLLEFDNAEVWNPHNVNPEGVDCDGIVANEKIISEREVRSVLAAMPNVDKHMDCIMGLYRTDNMFDSQHHIPHVFRKINQQIKGRFFLTVCPPSIHFNKKKL